MSQRVKDPSEVITVTFDFSALATSVANPAISCTVVAGQVDATAQAMISGTPQIAGTTVLQRIIGGQHGNTYKLRCQIDDADGERWVVADTLLVQTC
ncbi:MAG TPA: hypothetical protein PKZ83_15670 [bacterium]|nr:hypothetical protein [bacterium]HQJ66380.1 hypothetical protein [bacterium]